MLCARAQSTAHFSGTLERSRVSRCAGVADSRNNDESSSRGINPADLDRSVSPCKDFYRFSEGGWEKRNPIPEDQPSWGVSEKLQEEEFAVLHQILEEAAKDKSAAPGSNLQKIGDFYASCMDQPQIEAAGAKPLDPEFVRIAAVTDVATLEAAIARLHRTGVGAVFRFHSNPDFKDSAQMIAEVDQGGVGLPDREYYTRDDEKSKQLRADYVAHIGNMFKLLGDDAATAAGEAKTVMDIEMKLAKASLTPVELRDPDNRYHKMALEQLRDTAPHFLWTDFFGGAGAPPVASLNVAQPDFFKAFDADLTSIPLADWKVYLRWHLVLTAAPMLSSKFENENFDFYHRKLLGTSEMLPRWRRCVEATDQNLGEALGESYVRKHFSPEAKARVTEMVKNVIAALREDLKTLDWMSPATRQKALEKLDAINIKVGYPDKWRDYSAFHVNRGPYVENALRGREFAVAYNLAKIGKPVDRGEWFMTPPTVNAYYSDSRNEIVFPAGILQPPLYDIAQDDAINYAEAGAAIGHEMTHGFDDQGAKFDARGNLKNWWTPEDLKNFQDRGECIAKQFDEFEVEPGLRENGKLEEGESIADLGGLLMAYVAYHKSLGGKPAPEIGGFSGDQRFFVAYAQSWTDEVRPEFARLMANSDEHPLARFRVLGPLANLPKFAEAFGCKSDSPIVRPAANRCRVW
jgi:putative endopeptidase